MKSAPIWQSAIAKLWAGLCWTGNAFVRCWYHLQRAWSALWRWIFRLAVIPILILVISNTFWLSHRDVSYRYSYPDEEACKIQARHADALATEENDNKEFTAIANSISLAGKPSAAELRSAFTCMIQTHSIPRSDGKGSLKYNLAFLEFTEAGLPIEFTENKVRLNQQTQLQELLAHLRKVQATQKTNFVLAFVHGWRHDARVGDEDVKKLRVFAAYTASFLAQRCEQEQKQDNSFCKYEVTAVYLGWRGARHDESWLRRSIGVFGYPFDYVFGVGPALLTLFDRKPVSERIAPAIASALRQVDRVIYDRDAGRSSDPEYLRNWKQRPDSRMITFGHSLGGNALASVLREEFVERVGRHMQNATMAAPFGDLIVLLNPAAEAFKWTSIQRAMREKIVFDHPNRTVMPKGSISESDRATLLSRDRDQSDISKGHDFFPDTQRPIYISLTAANTWPVGGIRRSDCDSYQKNQELKKEADKLTYVQFLPKYDFATHDAFPAFKGDLRPLAETIDRWSKYRADKRPLDQYCSDEPGIISWLAESLAGFLRNFPFMNTDVEETRTIGHLNPMRSFIGAYRNDIRTATFFGTTHELTIIDPRKPDPKEKSTSAKYRLAGDMKLSKCEQNNGWLTAARAEKNNSNGVGWSRQINLFSTEQGKQLVELKGQFLHGFVASGMRPTVRANDPFWNVRVFDTGMQYHGDYDSFPLICTIQQLVIDNITDGRR